MENNLRYQSRLTKNAFLHFFPTDSSYYTIFSLSI